jgi:hypothetical protein
MRKRPRAEAIEAARDVRYDVEHHAGVWCLVSICDDGQRYLICAYEDRESAEQALSHLNGKKYRIM